MDSAKQLTVDSGGSRLDRFLALHCPELSRSYIQKLTQAGWITVNAQVVRPALKLKAGDRISVTLPPPQPSQLAAERIPLDVRYEDENLIVINKPHGMTTHPAPGNRSGTLVNALLAMLPKLPDADSPERPGIVHRLDKDTSGLIVVAKNRQTMENLSDQFKSRQITKVYLALVRGRLKPEKGTIDAPVGRNPAHRQKMAVVSNGRPAQTAYRVLRYLGNYTLLELQPKTGRTHQLRVHLAGIGYPIVGDAIYGSKSDLVPRQFLHAYKLTFRLPATGKEVTFTAPLPDDLESALESLGHNTDKMLYNNRL